MVKVACWLEEAGADYLAIACNTAHYFYEAIDDAVSIPVVNIMEETARRIAQEVGPGSLVGLLATDGTVQSWVFQSYLEDRVLVALAPSPEEQRQVMELIYGKVKANQPYDPSELLRLAESLRNRGCDAVLVGCTELSVIYRRLNERPDYLYDSLDVLAARCVEIYVNARRDECLPEL
jgi:aspartate racemase